MGAKVIAAASSAEKLELCQSLGADEVINYNEESLKDRIKELTGGKGVDVVCDPVGGDYAEPAVRALAWEGRYLVIGFPAGIPKIPLNLTLLKSCQIVGVFWGAFTMREPVKNAGYIDELFSFYKDGKIRPRITASFPLEQAAEALNLLQERKATGKVVLTM